MFSIVNSEIQNIFLRQGNSRMPITVALPETGGLLNTSNSAPADFDGAKDLPAGFWNFFLPLHQTFTPRQRELASRRAKILQAALDGSKPSHRFPSDTVRNGWKITLPTWCQDQRNQMTGPADDAELCVKMLNSGAPGVMLDLEDSCVNEWTHHQTGVANILACLRGDLTYYDTKRQRAVEIQPSGTVIFTRPRGLHMNQSGLIQQILGLLPGRWTARRGSGLRRSYRHPAGRRHRWRACPLLWARPDHLRSLALRAGADPEAWSA